MSHTHFFLSYLDLILNQDLILFRGRIPNSAATPSTLTPKPSSAETPDMLTIFIQAFLPCAEDTTSRISTFKISTISRLESFFEKRKVSKAVTALIAAAKALTRTGSLKNSIIFSIKIELSSSSLLPPCYSGRVAENSVVLPSRSMPPKTGFIECIKDAKMEQVVFFDAITPSELPVMCEWQQ